MKKVLNSTIFQCIIIFISTYIVNTFLYSTYDHIIDFTHCLSLANGLKLYKDFNIIIGPIYPIFIAVFLILFGKNLLVFNIINSLIVVCIYLVIKKNNKNTLALPIIILLSSVLIAKYNTFTLLLFYLIYYLESKSNKYQDYLIGLLLALLIFTKINIGVFLLLPTFILYFKDYKKIFKRLLAFFSTSILIILIMYLAKDLNDFFNYSILGLINFNESSLQQINTFGLYILLIIVTIIYIIFNIKKEKKLLYMLCYLIMAYPLLDYRHTLLAIIPTIIYFIDNRKLTENIKIISLITSIALSITYIFLIDFPISKIDCKNKYCSQDKIFNYTFDYVHRINTKLNKKKYANYNIYYLNYNAYFYKLDLNENINKYDFIWEGNMGYNGANKYIKEIKKDCQRNKCLFIIDPHNIYDRRANEKISYKILKFVIDEYKETNEIKYDDKDTSTKFYTN